MKQEKIYLFSLFWPKLISGRVGGAPIVTKWMMTRNRWIHIHQIDDWCSSSNYIITLNFIHCQLRYNFDSIETLYHQLFIRSAFRTVPDKEVSKLNWENASVIEDSLETIVLSVSSLMSLRIVFVMMIVMKVVSWLCREAVLDDQ